MKNIKQYLKFFDDEGLQYSFSKNELTLIGKKKSCKYKLFNYSKIGNAELNALLLETTDNFVFAETVIDFETFKLLKKLRVNFLDSAGNKFINFDGVHISIFHTTAKQRSNIKGPSPLKSAGIKFAFHLLKEGRDFLDKNLTDCAEIAKVSLGAASKFRKVFEEFYLNDFDELDERHLINDFTASYNNLMKPKYVVGEYYCDNLQALLSEDQVIISGQHAVKFHKPNVSAIPRFAHIYLNRENIGEMVLKYKLRRYYNSNVMIFETPFSLTEKYVPLFLAYADLIGSSDPRDKELALEIFSAIHS